MRPHPVETLRRAPRRWLALAALGALGAVPACEAFSALGGSDASGPIAYEGPPALDLAGSASPAATPERPQLSEVPTEFEPTNGNGGEPRASQGTGSGQGGDATAQQAGTSDTASQQASGEGQAASASASATSSSTAADNPADTNASGSGEQGAEAGEQQPSMAEAGQQPAGSEAGQQQVAQADGGGDTGFTLQAPSDNGGGQAGDGQSGGGSGGTGGFGDTVVIGGDRPATQTTGQNDAASGGQGAGSSAQQAGGGNLDSLQFQQFADTGGSAASGAGGGGQALNPPFYRDRSRVVEALAGAPAGSRTRVAVVRFGHGAAALDSGDRQTLKQLAEIYTRLDRGVQVRVTGHASRRVGTDQANEARQRNQQMAQQRARNVADALAGNGIARERIQLAARAADDPQYSEVTEAAEAKNRRAVVTFTLQ